MTYEEKLDRLLAAVEQLRRKIDAIEEFPRMQQLHGDNRSDWDRIYPDRRARYLH